jgi:alcohol dehydrogenase (NADP+)
MLGTHGHFVTVGIPDEPPPRSNAMSLLGHGAVFGGSHSANKEECLQIHQLVVHKNIKP